MSEVRALLRELSSKIELWRPKELTPGVERSTAGRFLFLGSYSRVSYAFRVSPAQTAAISVCREISVSRTQPSRFRPSVRKIDLELSDSLFLGTSRVNIEFSFRVRLRDGSSSEKLSCVVVEKVTPNLYPIRTLNRQDRLFGVGRWSIFIQQRSNESSSNAARQIPSKLTAFLLRPLQENRIEVPSRCIGRGIVVLEDSENNDRSSCLFISVDC